MIYLLPGKELKVGQAVRVYRNVKKHLFSIQDKKTRRLIGHADNIFLIDVEMKIGRAGQKRVRRERQKNIHAFIVGTYVGSNNNEQVSDSNIWKLIHYNPYETDTFINLENGEPVFTAKKSYLGNGKCFISME